MTSASSAPLLVQLRSATWHRHEKFERLPFVTAMMNGTLPPESYIGQLRGLAVIFSAVDQAIDRELTTLLSRIRPLINTRFKMMSADLAFFSPRLVPDIFPAVRHSLACARNIRSLSGISSDRLIGSLYVLQGTARGNQVHLPDIIRCFDLHDDCGVSFYRGFGADTDARWEEFSAIINGFPDISLQDAIAGAMDMFDALDRFHEALYPLLDMNFGYTATAINPEAGDHPVPQNPVILQAAITAGRRCHEEFSYYERRYGERGRRFTDSDAAWLALLAEQPEEVVRDQVLWLGRVLSSRGMPLLLLERQLELLVEELVATGSVAIKSLQAVQAALKQHRCDLMSQSRFDETCRMVARNISHPLATGFPDLPFIFVAAHIDTLAGMPECMASLACWLKDSSTMTEEEIQKLTEIIQMVV